MARKSRKNTAGQVKVPESPSVRTFSTAIYVRLSIENSGKDDDGDSIENQTGISRKIITSFRQRQETGNFLPGNPPYDYIKSKTRQFRYDVDEKVAPYIRMLFEWKAAGVSHAEMARRLNEMEAVTPARRKVELGIWCAEKYKHTVWGGRTLIDILTNPVYTGALVYGKIPKSLYEGIKMQRAPREEWRILEGMHEPIVSKELFDKVQDIFDRNKKVVAEKYAANAKNRKGVGNRFKGKIVCAIAGRT